MKAQRSLIVGALLATTWVIGLAGWQLVGGCGDLVPAEPSTSSSGSDSSEQRDMGVTNSGEGSPQEQVAAEARRRMVEQQLAARDIRDQRVLEAMAEGACATCSFPKACGASP